MTRYICVEKPRGIRFFFTSGVADAIPIENRDRRWAAVAPTAPGAIAKKLAQLAQLAKNAKQ